MAPRKWGFGRKNSDDPAQILGEDPLHPHGDAEIVETSGSNYELHSRTSMHKTRVDIPDVKVIDEELGEAEAARKLKAFKRDAQWDMNIPISDLDAVEDAVEHHDANGEVKLVGELVENSPYPEVSQLPRQLCWLR